MDKWKNAVVSVSAYDWFPEYSLCVVVLQGISWQVGRL